MTCIIGLVDKDGTVWMGGDRRSSEAGEYWSEQTPKILRKTLADSGKVLLLGQAGDAIGLAMHQFTPPAYRNHESGEEYVLNSLMPELQKMLRTLGLLTDGDVSFKNDNVFLVGFAGSSIGFQERWSPI